MPAQRCPGMDHDHYPWSPLPDRKPLQWPNGARVALGAILVLEHHEWDPPQGAQRAANVNLPDLSIAQHSMREYGHRVGIFRLIELFEKHGLKPTIAIDKLTAENYPSLVNYVQDKKLEVIAHGIARTRMISSAMTEAEEASYIKESIETVRSITGDQPAGWFGPDYGESERTPRLLAEAGISYVCDWPNDDQPYRMTTPTGELFALPPLYDLDDHVAIVEHQMTPELYARELRYAAEQLSQDADSGGRLMLMVLRPWISGQPFRSSYLDDAFAEITKQPGIWPATGREIIDAVRAMPAR